MSAFCDQNDLESPTPPRIEGPWLGVASHSAGQVAGTRVDVVPGSIGTVHHHYHAKELMVLDLLRT